jgi:hypothetical protein
MIAVTLVSFDPVFRAIEGARFTLSSIGICVWFADAAEDRPHGSFGRARHPARTHWDKDYQRDHRSQSSQTIPFRSQSLRKTALVVPHWSAPVRACWVRAKLGHSMTVRLRFDFA